jgi:hypothetical protein
MKNQLADFPNGLNVLKKHEDLVDSVETSESYDTVI